VVVVGSANVDLTCFTDRFPGPGETVMGGRLQIHPGRARGWGEDSWPFTQDANDSVEPLLLPWRDRPVRYRLRGGRLVH